MLMKDCTPSRCRCPRHQGGGGGRAGPAAADGEGALDEQGKQGEHGEDADETQFFGNHAKQEIGGPRQIEEFFTLAPRPTPNHPRPKAISEWESW